MKLVPLGHALSIFLALSFTLCILWGLATPPEWHMHPAFEPLLPGFEFLTATGFAIGLVESYAYGWYIALLTVPLYRLFARG